MAGYLEHPGQDRPPQLRPALLRPPLLKRPLLSRPAEPPAEAAQRVPARLGVGIPLLIGLVHVALVAPHYHVGSFDDDSSYILTAKVLLAGHGLSGHLTSGEPLIGLYPPGYSALLAPLLWIWPHNFLPLRLLSAACFAAVFPLLWVWLGHRRVAPAVRGAALLVLALGPPFATFGSMVMAEAPFLVVLLLLLLAVDRWRDEAGALNATGLAVVILAAGLVWLKQAGVGLVLGLVLWLPWSRAPRRWLKAAALVAGVAVTLVPVLVARAAAGVPLAGARYSQELGGYYHGGLVKRLVDVVPGSTWHLLSTAVPATLVPYLDPLPQGDPWGTVWQVLSWHVTVLAALGAFLWARRHRDAVLPMTLVYLGESVLWPFVNERRAILVLPLLVAWYVTGAAWLWSELNARMAGRRPAPALRAAGAAVAAVVVVAPLAAQIPRDYLYGWGQSGSNFSGSRYAAVLRHLGSPTDVVETDYRWSTALFTGHVTEWNAFIYNIEPVCYEPGLLNELNSDRAGYLLLGDVNKPGQVDNQCLAQLAPYAPWAVEILHSQRDDARVYELIGPYSGHPGLVDVLAHAGPARYQAGDGRVSLTWALPAPTPLSQLSVGGAYADVGTTGRVRLQVERQDGEWTTVAGSPSGVGDGAGRAPYLLASPGAALTAVGVRVIVEGPDAAAGVTVQDVAVLGPRRGAS